MTSFTRRHAMLLSAAAALIGGGIIRRHFLEALDSAERRIVKRSSTIATRFGHLEYAVSGTGQPLLMVHGTGGGFDQGLLFASGLQRRGHRIIAPSRFGYLRSDYPAKPSLTNQADAFATLLDRLGINQLPVVAGSAGALSATAFALRHPLRCSTLVLLVPAANVDGRDPVQMGAMQEKAVRLLLNSDFLYWSLLQIAPEQLIGTILATDPALLGKVDAAERRRAFAILSAMLPIRARTQGMLNDALQAGSPANLDFSQLRVPLLLISAEDDRFGTANTARKIAARVAGAELEILADGGHIWLGHDDAVADRISQFLNNKSH